jgi:hypothetical protein
MLRLIAFSSLDCADRPICFISLGRAVKSSILLDFTRYTQAKKSSFQLLPFADL